MFFSLDHLRFDYRPYPIGIAAPVMAEARYREFVEAFPPIELFLGYEQMGARGVKFTLSEKENPKNYYSFVSSHPLLARVPPLGQVRRFHLPCTRHAARSTR